MKKQFNTKDLEGNSLEINISTERNYFSITGIIWQKGRSKIDKNIICLGPIHEDILKAVPDFKIIVNLHLSDLDGTPRYAVENGYYFYQIIKGLAKYHKIESDDSEKYTKVLSEHLRINSEETQKLISVLDQLDPTSNFDLRKAYFTKFVESKRQDWKNEAERVMILIESL